MISGKYAYDQLQELSTFSRPQALIDAGPSFLGNRVTLMPRIPGHSSFALEAKSHALVQVMAGSFAPPVVGYGGPRHFDGLPHVAG